MHLIVRFSGVGLRQALILYFAAGIGLAAAVNVRAQTLYVTNLDRALTMARETGRSVMLYTGQSALCRSNNPQDHLIKYIFENHPKLAARADRYVICEQFIHRPAKDTNGNATASFLRDARKLEPLFDRYDLRFYWPTLTFLDEKGQKLNGPFSQLYSEYAGCVGCALFSNGRDCYNTLEDYAEAEHPVGLNLAQSNLVAAVLQPSSGENKLAFFRFTEQTNGTGPPLLMENGLMSRRYKLGERFAFLVRDCTNTAYPGTKHQWPVSVVDAAGHFEHSQPFEGSFMLQLNGVHFVAKTLFTGRGPDYIRGYGAMRLREEEYYFSIETRQKTVAETMLGALERLQNNPDKSIGP